MVDRTIATIIGFLLPGIGQIFQGDIQRGVPMFIIAILLWAFIPYSYLVIVAAIIYQLYSGYNAYMMSKDENKHKVYVD